ncbi:MAG: sulfatase-like hydrolase/transferase, partial [Burkholderiales bacterium]|nr:sulfatase-like hydrolase/transferase [Burkholderiales bacterium]
PVLAVLQAIEDAGLGEHFIVVGTHALYAYETAASVRIVQGALATQDVDLLWDARKRVRFVTDLGRLEVSMLQVLQRVGVSVFWRDNQSGCKGVCDGLPSEMTAAARVPGLCDGGHCFDEVLLQGLDAAMPKVDSAARDRLVVLHQLGNHGPAYFLRYPPAFKRFTPACETEDLRLCSREQIVNAYDNALLYTDAVLAKAIAWLRQRSGDSDTALIYLSDHGESLGENGLYLHGLPYAIAPEVQKRVPMLMWLSDGMAGRLRLNRACLRARAAEPASHDNLFHTLLGWFDVRSTAREPALDLLAACRGQPGVRP